jgi:two-component system sensor histidine kinase PilS (NtrC family)
VLSYVRVLLVSAIVAVASISESGLLGSWQPRTLVASYFVLALVIVILNMARLGSYRVLLASALAVDLLHTAGLIYWSELSRSVFASLLFLPVVGSALLATQLAALGTASMATIILLIISFIQYTGAGDETTMLQTALLGIGFLATSLVLNKMGRRVLDQEAQVREQKRRLETQMQINRTVVSELDHGLLALNTGGEAQILNLQAARLLGLTTELGRPVQSVISASYPALMQKMQEWQKTEFREAVPTYWDMTIEMDSPTLKKGTQRRIRARPLAKTGTHTDMNELLVALEDLREMEVRATQLKLASMGRLTASIAHEIRNPLAAVSHAAGLMSEEAVQTAPRLLELIQQNVKRIDRIVTDVLSISRSGRACMEVISLAEAVAQAISELHRDSDKAPDWISQNIPAQCQVWFDRSHLAQILNNLLENAARYASKEKNAISISARMIASTNSQEGDTWELSVTDDGPGLSAEARAYLFEPFFTTHPQGTGLGLYLARELALANNASLFLGEYNKQSQENKGASFVLCIGTLPGRSNAVDLKEK